MHSWIQADLLLLRLGFFMQVFHIMSDQDRKIHGEKKKARWNLSSKFCSTESQLKKTTPWIIWNQNLNYQLLRSVREFWLGIYPDFWDPWKTPEGFEVWVFNRIVSHTMQLLQMHHGHAQSWSWSKCAKHEAFHGFWSFFFDFNVGEEKIGRLWDFWFAEYLLSAVHFLGALLILRRQDWGRTCFSQIQISGKLKS